MYLSLAGVSTELLVAIMSAIIAIMSAVLSLWGQVKVAKFTAEREERRERKAKAERAEEIVSRYREPLLNAAFELQSRIFNILKLDMLGTHYKNGGEREKAYVVDNTAYVIAQYLGWSEIIRSDALFLDLGGTDRTRRLSEIQDLVRNVFLDTKLGSTLRIFRGDQRAIGELMTEKHDNSIQCMGYASFVMNKDPAFRAWFAQIREDIEKLAGDLAAGTERLTRLQHALVELIDYLDPDCVRFPAHRRGKV